MALYLDASALLPMLIDEPASATIDAFMERSAEPMVVSEFAAAEVASALSRLVRMGALSGDDANERLADFDSWRAGSTSGAETGEADIRGAHAFVRRFDLMLRAPDALHLALCRRWGFNLVTLDQRLATAAEALGVPVEPLA